MFDEIEFERMKRLQTMCLHKLMLLKWKQEELELM